MNVPTAVSSKIKASSARDDVLARISFFVGMSGQKTIVQLGRCDMLFLVSIYTEKNNIKKLFEVVAFYKFKSNMDCKWYGSPISTFMYQYTSQTTRLRL